MSLARSDDAIKFDNAFLRAFCELLGTRTGLQIRDKDYPHIARVFDGRCHELKLTSSEYVRLLRVQSDTEGEWLHLLPRVTNGESYFERDKGQFELLKTKILPELIEERRKVGEHTLRLWSAGCSTGEEAYSLAITVDSVLPVGWSATILGTDINAQSLQKARLGVYGTWSFRGVETSTVSAYFRPVAGGQQIVSSLRSRVKFEPCNLSASDWPSNKRGIDDMDLIMCRNVLIYFRRPVISDILARFVRTLRPRGFLMTGHAELHDQEVSPLRPRLFAESAIYQKVEEPNSAVRPIMSHPTPASLSGLLKVPASPSVFRPLLPRFTPPTLVSQTSVEPLGASSAKEKTAQDWCNEARKFANCGEYENALICCRKAIEVDTVCADAYNIWAQICEEQGQRNEAKNLLRKVIYLLPTHVQAYLDLASLHERDGDAGKARQMRGSALETLRASNALTPEQTGLREHLEAVLGGNEITPAAKIRGSKW